MHVAKSLNFINIDVYIAILYQNEGWCVEIQHNNDKQLYLIVQQTRWLNWYLLNYQDCFCICPRSHCILTFENNIIITPCMQCMHAEVQHFAIEIYFLLHGSWT